MITWLEVIMLRSVDLKSGYFQMAPKAAGQIVTAFTILTGLIKKKRLLMGLVSATGFSRI